MRKKRQRAKTAVPSTWCAGPREPLRPPPHKNGEWPCSHKGGGPKLVSTRFACIRTQPGHCRA
eukprot:5042634-Pyramimonas_sp.AAC.1